jgi:K+ potassium transporter
MALLSLALPAAGPLRNALLVVGLGDASLFFGDSMITPAITVLSAVEGAEVATPLLKPYVRAIGWGRSPRGPHLVSFVLGVKYGGAADSIPPTFARSHEKESRNPLQSRVNLRIGKP